MYMSKPEMTFVEIDLDASIVTDASYCGGVETEPGGGVACSNSYYITLYDNCGDSGSAPQLCTVFCG